MRDYWTINDLITNLDGDPLDLPEMAAVCYHPSAGLDFSPLVFFSWAYLKSECLLDQVSPTHCHIFSSILFEQHEQILMDAINGDGILYENGRTRIRMEGCQLLKLNPDVRFKINPRLCHLYRAAVFQEAGADGFFAEIVIEDKIDKYQETSNLIYMLTENHITYHRLMEYNVSIKHIVATCEGLSFGGCGRSVFEAVFDSEYLRRYKKAKDLKTVVVREHGQAWRLLEQAKEQGLIDFERVGTYIGGLDVACRIQVL